MIDDVAHFISETDQQLVFFHCVCDLPESISIAQSQVIGQCRFVDQSCSHSSTVRDLIAADVFQCMGECVSGIEQFP